MAAAKSSASTEALELLHRALASKFDAILKEGVTKLTKHGEVVQVDADAAYFNTIRQFLKDNGIDAVASPGAADPLSKLTATVLPYLKAVGDEE